jgi:nucleoside 2-deoxyribosyltransferase
MTDTRYVHVIMPIGSDPFVPAKKMAIAKGVKQAGLEARFPDYLPDKPTFHLPDLIAEIRDADSIIADLSHERPSCYYELGIAEAIGKKVHLIAEAATPIHQSVARSLVHYYVNINDLARTVESALKESS